MTLIIMAAGLGTRYGGNKQLDRVGPNGEILMEYSIYDAIRTGFTKVVFIIKREMEENFRRMIGDKIARKVCVEYAFQEFSNLPGNFVPPTERTKPYGTVHAVLSAKNLVNEPFAVINADDYYGRDAFSVMVEKLSSLREGQAAMVAYSLKNTVSQNGTVTRGICERHSDGALCAVKETYNIKLKADGTICDSDECGETILDPDALVSMNFWGFTPEFFELAERKLTRFLNAKQENPLKCEYVLPTLVDELMKEQKLRVDVLSTDAVWFGITYQADKPYVMGELEKLHKMGVYPQRI